jgi:tRNA/tmRNA/rRNA uracil-C5-methylase (TrmA/RlmC/RlmD family)
MSLSYEGTKYFRTKVRKFVLPYSGKYGGVSSTNMFVRVRSAIRSAQQLTVSPRLSHINAATPPLPAVPLGHVVVGDEVEVECTAVAFGGRGVCKLPSGFVILCERAVPGEKVHARITATKKGGQYAEAIKVYSVRPSPYAVYAPCPYFDRCGGCTWLDVAYDRQLAFKRDQVVDAMTRIARINNAEMFVKAILPSERKERYRNKMEFAFAPAENDSSGRPTLGMRPSGDHAKLVQVLSTGCALQHLVADAVLTRCAAHLRCMTDASATLPAFNRRTGCGVLRSLTLRTAPLSGNTGEGTIVTVVIAAALDRQRIQTTKAFAALAADLATIDGVQSVIHEHVLSEPELRRAEGRKQVWVKGGRGKRGLDHEGCNGERGSNRVRSKGKKHEHIICKDKQRFTVLHGPATMSIRLCGVVFTLSAQSFFQTNTEQAEHLVEIVEEACALSGDKTEVILDLFCGVGTLGLCLASKAHHIYGCEIVSEAVVDAKNNATANGIENATFWQANLANPCESMPCLDNGGVSRTIFFGKDIVRPDVVIVDPARSGLDPSLVATLRSLGIPRIVYVSCNPATQARDVALLCNENDGVENTNRNATRIAKYRLISCVPVDMFPHTPHVETVAVLVRVVEH